MSNKLKLSKESSDQVDYLSTKLGLRRNIQCRLAIGRSLAVKNSVRNIYPKDNLGREYNRSTITGEHDKLFQALINQHEKKRLNDFEFFSKFLRNHIERGINLLVQEFDKINSPIEFIIGLINEKERDPNQIALFSNK